MTEDLPAGNASRPFTGTLSATRSRLLMPSDPSRLVASGRPVAQVAADLAISEQTIYVWRRQHLIDTGQLPGRTGSENAELVA